MRLPCRPRRRDHRTEPPHAARGPRQRSSRDGGTRTRVLGTVYRWSRRRSETPERGGLPARSVPPADAGVLLHLAVRRDDRVLQPHVGRDRFSADGILFVLGGGRLLGTDVAAGGIRCRPRHRQIGHAGPDRNPQWKGGTEGRGRAVGAQHGGDAREAESRGPSALHRTGGREVCAVRGDRAGRADGGSWRARGRPWGGETQRGYRGWHDGVSWPVWR